MIFLSNKSSVPVVVCESRWEMEETHHAANLLWDYLATPYNSLWSVTMKSFRVSTR